MTSDIIYKNNPLQQLKGFCYTVKEGSMSKAAHKTGLSQGAISQQIKSLERDLGFNLFIRIGNKIELTKEGEIFYRHSTSCLEGVESLFRDIPRIMSAENDLITIGSNHVGISYILPKYISSFRDKYDKSKFKVINASRQDCFDSLLNNEVDLVLYQFPSLMLYLKI